VVNRNYQTFCVAYKRDDNEQSKRFSLRKAKTEGLCLKQCLVKLEKTFKSDKTHRLVRRESLLEVCLVMMMMTVWSERVWKIEEPL